MRAQRPGLIAFVSVAALAACSASRSTSETVPPTDVSTSSIEATSTTGAPSTTAAATAPPTAPSTEPPPTTAPATTPPSTAPPTAPPTLPPITVCRVENLGLGLGAVEGAAGSSFVPLVLSNVGSVACTLQGRPDVWFVDASGNPIGPPAGVSDGPAIVVQLAPGGQAHATFRTSDAVLFGEECLPVTASLLQVLPPGTSTPLTIDFPFDVCTGAIVGPQFSVGAVSPGASG